MIFFYHLLFWIYVMFLVYLCCITNLAMQMVDCHANKAQEKREKGKERCVIYSLSCFCCLSRAVSRLRWWDTQIHSVFLPHCLCLSPGSGVRHGWGECSGACSRCVHAALASHLSLPSPARATGSPDEQYTQAESDREKGREKENDFKAAQTNENKTLKE